MIEDLLEQETLAWLAELSNTRLPLLISGQLRLLENENQKNCNDTHCS